MACRGARRAMRLSARLSAILVWLAAVAGDANAQTTCPKAAETSKGLSLADAFGRKAEITWQAGNRVRVAEANPAVPRNFPREIIAFRGLMGLETAGPSGKARVSYQTAAESIFPLTVGKQHDLAYTSHVEGQAPLKGVMKIAVIEALQHKIGSCSYEALLVGRYSVFEDGRLTPMRYDVYVPALQAVLKSTLFDETTKAIIEAETYEYETIAVR